jgi:hypothetical protein
MKNLKDIILNLYLKFRVVVALVTIIFVKFGFVLVIIDFYVFQYFTY